MELKHYMDELNKPVNNSNNYLIEVDYYDRISDDKKELLKSVFQYLSSDSFLNLLHIYNDFKYPIKDTGYIQCISEDGNNRLLVPIKVSFFDDLDYNKPTEVLPEEAFDKKYNKYRKVGSQDYTEISIERKMNSEESGKISIIYTADGGVFLNEDAAVAIAWKSVDELGKQLATACKYRDQALEKDNEHYQKIMVKNYRHCK